MSLLKEHYHRTIFFYSLLLIACTLPFTVRINSVFIIILCLNWIIEGDLKNKLKLFFRQKTALYFLAFYVLHLLGMLYTSEIANGAFELEKKLSLVILPLVLSTTAPIDKEQLQRILKGFLISCSLAALICIFTAVFKYLKFPDASYFFYHAFSGVIGMHAVYFSFYLSFCIFYLLIWYRSARENRLLFILWILFLIFIMFLLASKVILLSAFLLINIFFLNHISNTTRSLRHYGFLVLVNALIIVSFMNLPGSRARFSMELGSNLSVLRQQEHTYNTPFTGTSLRLVIWKFCFEILNENYAWLHGTGTGDGQVLLDAKYREHKLYTGNPGSPDRGYLGYNAHNQYMNTLLCHGLIGLFLLLALLVMLFKQAWMEKKWLLVGMLLVFCFFSFTETTLATQKGVVFFTFFASLLLYQFRENDMEK